jgi:tetratricopeptide (TPR) repeat protein
MDTDAGHFIHRALEAEPWNPDARQLLDALNEAPGADAAASPQSVSVSPETLYEKGLSRAEAGDEAGALDILAQLVAAHPDHAEAHSDLGVLCYRSGDSDRAQTHYERAAELDPANPTFQKNLADFYWVARGDVEKGLEIYVNLLAADPFDVEALLATARICMDMSMDTDAGHFIHRALEAEPWSTDARQLLNILEGNPQAAAG